MDALLQLKQLLADRYDIQREIGAGGMATVYLAHDLRNDRPVAVKVLNPELGAVLGVERFLSEIRVTANLQHPNLLPLFDSGAADGLLYYVMPYVEGESLRGRLDRENQLPIGEAIDITISVANALDYAHSHGVIHRDLKPGNILIQAGQPCVADFGIALAVKNAGGNRLTRSGMALGTPQYMSPEQAAGDRNIDGRSDIYSLGVVAYEMLTGEPPHTGASAQAIVARMLTEKPRSMRATRPSIPPQVEHAVQCALEKLPADRFSSAHQFAEALHGHSNMGTTWLLESGQTRSEAPFDRRQFRPFHALTWGTIGIVAISFVGIAFAVASRPDSRTRDKPVRFTINAADSLRPVENYPWPAAISPDGSTVVYSVASRPHAVLYSLSTDKLEPQPIPGTSGATQTVFSPDGQSIAFLSGGKLRRVRLDGSAPVAIADGTANNGADWTVRDEIVLASEGDPHGLARMDASGGPLTVFARADSTKGEIDYLWPVAAPDGKSVVFTIWKGAQLTAELATVSISGGSVTKLGVRGLRPLAIIDRTVIYVQFDGQVMAIEVDRSHRRSVGRPIPVLDPVSVVPDNNGNSDIYVSSGGALVSGRGAGRSQLSWLSRDGSVTPVSKELRVFGLARLSPDGRRIAVNVRERERVGVWIYDVRTGLGSQLSTVPITLSPEWSHDGSRLYFLGLDDDLNSVLYSQSSDGGTPATKVAELYGSARGFSIAPDDKSIVYVTYVGNTYMLYSMHLDSGGSGHPFAPEKGNMFAPTFSPDGKWVAMTVQDATGTEIYLCSYPVPSVRMQISTNGGGEPMWAKDGRTLFYRSGPAEIAAKLTASPTPRVTSRDTVIRSMTGTGVIGIARSGDVSAGGRFLGIVTNKGDFQLVVVPNWKAELEQRLARARQR